MKKPSFINRVLSLATSVVYLLTLSTPLVACTFSRSEARATRVFSPHHDVTGCLASEQQISLRDCLTAVSNARLVDAYTLGQLR